MELHILLGDADRERLGAPDPLVYDSGTFMVSEATALYKSAGLTRETLNEALKSRDPEGRKAITWLALRRVGVQVRYSELDYNMLDWALRDPNPQPEPDPDGAGDDGADEGNSGALPSEGPTPQS